MATIRTLEAAQSQRIALVDIENLVGGSTCSSHDVAIAFDHFDAAAHTDDADLVFVAAAPNLALWCGYLRPAAKLWCACGVDGAELRLMHEVPVDFVAERTRELVIGSGDHLFVDYALAARAAGVHVRVVGRHRAIHHRFWTHGFEIVEIHPSPDGPGPSGLALAA